MAFLSLILALLLDQVKHLHVRAPVLSAFAEYAATVARNFNAGQWRHGLLGWVICVVPWVVLANLGYLLLYGISPIVGLAWSVCVLYLSLGFRDLNHGYQEVLEALRAGQLDQARARLALWRGEPADEFTRSEVAKVAIETGLMDSHRHVFGVIAWFVLVPAVLGTLMPGWLGVLLAGPGGAVLYRLSASLRDSWGTATGDDRIAFGAFARDAFRALDWLPARMTALSFAIVGDFEDAVYCWRAQAAGWYQPQQGVILASGAGAIGVRLGETLHLDGTVSFRPELGLGDEADVEHMQSAIGLIWRALVLWVLLVALLTLASLFGG